MHLPGCSVACRPRPCGGRAPAAPRTAPSTWRPPACSTGCSSWQPTVQCATYKDTEDQGTLTRLRCHTIPLTGLPAAECARACGTPWQRSCRSSLRGAGARP